MECSTRNFHLQSSNLGIALHRITTMSFFFFHLILVPSVTPVSFTFDSFNLSNPDMKYEGDAFQSNGVIQLTKDKAYRNLNYCSGRAIYGDPVRIWDRATLGLADFTTHFSFSIDTLHQSDHGDGLAFFLVANKSLPSNSAGSCLGLVNCDNGLNTSHYPYVAVEFDTFPNAGDPNYDHIGINLNSLESVKTVGWLYESKVRNKARVSYDSSTKNFSVFLSYDDSPTAYTSASYHVDLRDYLPEWVTIGFSASTGAVFQIHSILDWDFQSSLGAVESQKIIVSDKMTATANRINKTDAANMTITGNPIDGTEAGSGGNGTIVDPINGTDAGSGGNETTVDPKKKNWWKILLLCVALGGVFVLIYCCCRRNQEDQITRNERAHHEMVSPIAVNGTIHETKEGMPVAINDPTPQITIPASNIEQEQYEVTREEASPSAFHGTIPEKNGGMPVSMEDPTAQNTIPASNNEQEQYEPTREEASPSAFHGTISETNGGMPVAIEDPTPQITIPASNIEQEQYAGTREMASSSGFHGTIDEMRPTPPNAMVSPASGTTGIVFPKEFSYRELVDATDNFTEMIGKGGFGQVFKGFFGDHNLEVAIKKFSKVAHDRGVKQFESEVKTLSRLRHENLVQLYGWCNEEKELLLVYEFMPNGSLWDRLFKEKRLLVWKERYKIVQDLASGLLHLHEEGASYIIHRDIKSSNVLLDVDFKAKLGDFGLARLVEEGEDPVTTYIAGTKGYLAPECEALRQKPSKKSDVYSFGIVVLEIGCGRKAYELVGNLELVQWVWMLYGNENILEAADPRLCKEFDENEVKCLLVVGLWCAHPKPIARPTIGEAYNMLLQKAPLPPIPEEMPFISGRGPSDEHPPIKVDGSSSSGKSYKSAPSGASQ